MWRRKKDGEPQSSSVIQRIEEEADVVLSEAQRIQDLVDRIRKQNRLATEVKRDGV